jgi:hypothetical protein
MSAVMAEPAPPCAACVVLDVRAEALDELAVANVPLDGLGVILPEGSPAAAIQHLLQRRALVWLLADTSDENLTRGLARTVTGVMLTLDAQTAADPDRAAFVIKRSASAIRGEQPEMRIALRADLAVLRQLASRGVGAYVDVIASTPGTSAPGESVRRADVDELAKLFRGLEVWQESRALDGDLIEGILRETAGASDTIVVPVAGRAAATARAVMALRTLLPPGLTSLSGIEVGCDECSSETWLHPETLDAIAVLRAPYPLESFTIAPTASRVDIADAQRGNAVQIPLAPAAGRLVATVPIELAGSTVVMAISGWRGGDETVYRTDVQVMAPRPLTVEEVVARHQAQRARQSAAVTSLVSKGTTVLAFEVPAFAGPVTVTARTTVFTRGALTEVAQHGIQVNGVELSSRGRVPRLPLIEPERVSAPPLAITLTAAYHYRLAGRERCGDRDCYVVAFEPAGASDTSFHGRAWIDALTFGIVRMAATQTGLSSVIISNEQREEFAPRQVEGRTVWLPVRSEMFQVYQAAGLRTPIHRRIDTPEHEVNPPDFDARRAQAHGSTAVMLRDTPEGFRYLVPSGKNGRQHETRVVSATAGRRVVTLAFGVLIDPNISVPLPYAGLSYLDFNLFGSGSQFSGFFGGSYGQAAWTVPRFLRPGWQLTGQAFGIGSSYNDRSFREGRERYDENIRQRPFRADTTLVIPVAPRAQVRLGYEFDYTAFGRGKDTAAQFVVPEDANVHGARLALDVQRGPWSALLWWNPARRVGWRRWGRPTDGFDRESADFQRYGAMLARTWVLGEGSVARLEGNWVDGHDLDRFSRFSFDGFANRLRGYPSASIRYEHGAVVRSVATWTPAPRLRLDGFVDYAAVHDPGFGRGLRSYPGVGAAIEVPLPHRMLVAVEWGYGFEARNTDGSRGTHVMRVSGFKVF